MDLALYFKGFQDLDSDIERFKGSAELQGVFDCYDDAGSQVFWSLLDPWRRVMRFSCPRKLHYRRVRSYVRLWLLME